MEDTCRNCLAQDVCDITGASCKKMDALFAQRKTIRNGRTTMSNTAKNSAAATPKDVKEKVEEKTVPAQATAEPKVEQQDGEQTPAADEKKKPSLVQRAKAAAEKLKQNKKALLILTGAAVVVGLTIKNNRKAVAVEPLDEAEGPINGVESADPDDTTDSL
ncbi:hypothetical protein SEA_CLUBPENGUIN_47 [Streptomyces phage ClubPenguin]|nr:hypothetical protein SEA_CLUBPENGUIN_47 [Streptomyces phage ClubPenguin]